MDNRHRWDELLAEVNGEESPAQQRQREIGELQRAQNDDNYVSTVVAEFAEQPNANGRVYPEEVLREAFRDYPQNAGELVEQIQDLHREIADQRLHPDTLLIHPSTADMIMRDPQYEEYSFVNTPADSVSGHVNVGRTPGPTETASGVIDLFGARIMNPDYGVSMDDIVEEHSMVATASGVLFGNRHVVPNEVTLPPQDLFPLVGEPVVAPTFPMPVETWPAPNLRPDLMDQGDLPAADRQHDDQDELPTLSGYNPFARDWDI